MEEQIRQAVLLRACKLGVHEHHCSGSFVVRVDLVILLFPGLILPQQMFCVFVSQQREVAHVSAAGIGTERW